MKKDEDVFASFATDIVNFCQVMADYYEEKKFRAMNTCIALTGFGALFASIFAKNILLVAGAGILIVFSLLAIIIYSAAKSVTPEIARTFSWSLRFGPYGINAKKSMKQNYEDYRKKFWSMSKKDIAEDGVAQAMALQYMCKNKIRTISQMNFCMFVGLAGFIFFVAAHAVLVGLP